MYNRQGKIACVSFDVQIRPEGINGYESQKKGYKFITNIRFKVKDSNTST